MLSLKEPKILFLGSEHTSWKYFKAPKQYLKDLYIDYPNRKIKAFLYGECYDNIVKEDEYVWDWIKTKQEFWFSFDDECLKLEK